MTASASGATTRDPGAEAFSLGGHVVCSATYTNTIA